MKFLSWWFAAVAWLSSPAFAEDVRFFDGSSINYWDSPAPNVDLPKAVPAPAVTLDVQSSGFSWQTVMDPKHDDFFKEGDYKPPAAFMEVARDPSDHNIRMWNAYIARKNELMTRLTHRLQEYSAQNVAATPLPVVQPASKPQDVNQDPKRFRIRMYFDSTCPQCQRMMTTLSDLAARGFDVEAKQIDERPLASQGAAFPVTRADPEDVKRHGISSVPFLLVGDLQREVVYKMAGFKTAGDIFSEIAAETKGGR